jgi:hypothetical protein
MPTWTSVSTNAVTYFVSNTPPTGLIWNFLKCSRSILKTKGKHNTNILAFQKHINILKNKHRPFSNFNLPMEGNTDFGTEHFNVLSIEALLGRLVHTPQEFAAVDAGLGRKSCKINFVVLGLEI